MQNNITAATTKGDKILTLILCRVIHSPVKLIETYLST